MKYLLNTIITAPNIEALDSPSCGTVDRQGKGHTPRKVQLECHSGSRSQQPRHIWFLSLNSLVALELAALGTETKWVYYETVVIFVLPTKRAYTL